MSRGAVLAERCGGEIAAEPRVGIATEPRDGAVADGAPRFTMDSRDLPEAGMEDLTDCSSN